jgi:hypothetical protein
MIQVNDDFYVRMRERPQRPARSLCCLTPLPPSPPFRPAQECLTPATTIQVLEACKKGTPLPMTQWGSRPMNGQLSCEGPLGATTLLTPRVGPVPTRDMPKKVDPAAVKKAMMY